MCPFGNIFNGHRFSIIYALQCNAFSLKLLVQGKIAKKKLKHFWAAAELSFELFLHFSAQFPLSCSNAFPLWSLACLCHAPKYYGSTFAIPYPSILGYGRIPVCHFVLWKSIYSILRDSHNDGHWKPFPYPYFITTKNKKKLHTLWISLIKSTKTT